MKLAQVFYEMFESDAYRLGELDSANIHEIDREIRLIDDDGNSTFISWCSDPVQYAVGISDLSFFDQSVPVIRNMSGSAFWKAFIDTPITLNFLDNHHQVLEIGNGDKVVYCWTSASDEEGEDTLFISTQRPEYIQS